MRYGFEQAYYRSRAGGAAAFDSWLLKHERVPLRDLIR
jgi:hypothetical protein